MIMVGKKDARNASSMKFIPRRIGRIASASPDLLIM